MDILDKPRQKVLSEIKRLKVVEKYSFQKLADKLDISVTYANYLVKGERGKQLDLMSIKNLWKCMGKADDELFKDCDPLLQRLSMIEDQEVQKIGVALLDELEQHPPEHREGIIAIIESTLLSIRSIRAKYPPKTSE